MPDGTPDACFPGFVFGDVRISIHTVQTLPSLGPLSDYPSSLGPVNPSAVNTFKQLQIWRDYGDKRG
jgi:hypothetical protein